MKILLLAGEESGLIYAKRLKALWEGHEVRGYGDYGFKTADLAVMGFAAVVKRLPYFIGVKRTMERAIDEWRPDVLCTIDYPGLNLKLAAYAKSRGVRTVHVVCPQVWAWKAGRIPKIEAALDRLCCFFPFEPDLFKPGFAEFVGHPLAESFGERTVRHAIEGEPPRVALLPGSRIGEIARILPVMLKALDLLPQVHVSIPAANETALSAIKSAIVASGRKEDAFLTVSLGGARDILLSSDAAVVASGTATLEAALARCPTVLVYKVDAFLAWFARRVIKGVKHIGLANIIWEKSGGEGVEPMPELLQEDFTPAKVAEALRGRLWDPECRARTIAALESVADRLGTGKSSILRISAAVLGGK
ncbi:MAG: hypothetical protein K6F50_07200 [Kiritimatiellae bacterium]|nr:hypothetical protein [Kiritimatiellia bacterium]